MTTGRPTSLAFACVHPAGMCVGADHPECCHYSRHQSYGAAKKRTAKIFEQPQLWRKINEMEESE